MSLASATHVSNIELFEEGLFVKSIDSGAQEQREDEEHGTPLHDAFGGRSGEHAQTVAIVIYADGVVKIIVVIVVGNRCFMVLHALLNCDTMRYEVF